MSKPITLVSETIIEQQIYLIRGQRIILDRNLAELYQVSTKALVQAVKRNLKRFPSDFIYLLTRQEVANLRSQNVTSSWGGRRYLPYAFTEQGIAMLSSVLKSERAIQVNIAIMRTFVKLKRAALEHKDLAEKFRQLEKRMDEHDEEIKEIFEAIRKLMSPPDSPKRRIGFLAD